jgi:hypothetical protein
LDHFLRKRVNNFNIFLCFGCTKVLMRIRTRQVELFFSSMSLNFFNILKRGLLLLKTSKITFVIFIVSSTNISHFNEVRKKTLMHEKRKRNCALYIEEFNLNLNIYAFSNVIMKSKLKNNLRSKNCACNVRLGMLWRIIFQCNFIPDSE